MVSEGDGAAGLTSVRRLWAAADCERVSIAVNAHGSSTCKINYDQFLSSLFSNHRIEAPFVTVPFKAGKCHRLHLCLKWWCGCCK